jgi:hypothetical protein
MQKRPSYMRQMAEKLDGWRTRFEARRSRAAGPAAVSSDTRENLESSKVAGDAAYAKLSELRAAAAQYYKVRREMDALWKTIDDAPPVEAPPAAPKPRLARTSTT